jgi:hypothetical protein
MYSSCCYALPILLKNVCIQVTAMHCIECIQVIAM